MRLHVCWGNYEGPHDHDVPLADILPILCRAKVGSLYLPFANPRHAHEYKVFQYQPLAEDQMLVAGVIDTITNYIEHPEVVADRLERIAKARSAIPLACSQAPIADSTPRLGWDGLPRILCGRSSPPWSRAPALPHSACSLSNTV